jgi:hypothetical protein
MRFHSFGYLNGSLNDVMKSSLIIASLLWVFSPLRKVISSPLVSQGATSLEFRVFDLLQRWLVILTLFEFILKVLGSLFDNLLVLRVL